MKIKWLHGMVLKGLHPDMDPVIKEKLSKALGLKRVNPEDHKFKVGDKVIFTNDFGVCWGVKTITSLTYRPTTRDDAGPRRPCYHYEGSDTPWFPVDERNLTLATKEDLSASSEELQKKYGFTPTIEQLGGCY